MPLSDRECPHCQTGSMLEPYARGWMLCCSCSAMLYFDEHDRCVRSSKIARGEALSSPKAWDEWKQE